MGPAEGQVETETSLPPAHQTWALAPGHSLWEEMALFWWPKGTPLKQGRGRFLAPKPLAPV